MPAQHSTDRFTQRTALGEASARAYDPLAAAFWHLGGPLPLRWNDPEARVIRDIVAEDADPNTTGPAAGRIMSERCAVLGLHSETACTVDVYVEARLVDPEVGDPEWICIARGVALGGASSVLQTVNVGWKRSFVRVRTGASGGTPVTLYLAVC